MFPNLLGLALSASIAVIGSVIFGSRNTVCHCNFESASETSLEVVRTLKSQLDRCGPEHLGAVCDSVTLEKALVFSGIVAVVSFSAGWLVGRSAATRRTHDPDEQPPRWHPSSGSKTRALQR